MEKDNPITTLLCLLCCQPSDDATAALSTPKKGDISTSKTTSTHPRCSVCSRCETLMNLAKASKKTLDETERCVRFRQLEVLQELRKIEGQLRVFQRWMLELNQVIQNSNFSRVESTIEKYEGLKKNKSELMQLRKNVLESTSGLQEYYQLVFGKTTSSQSTKTQLPTTKDSRVPSTNNENISDHLHEEEHVGIKTEIDSENDNHDDYSPNSPSSPLSPQIKTEPLFEDSNEKMDEIANSSDPEDKHDCDVNDLHHEPIEEPNATNNDDEDKNVKKVTETKGESKTPPQTRVNYYEKHFKEIHSIIDKFDSFKRPIIKRILLETKQREAEATQSNSKSKDEEQITNVEICSSKALSLQEKLCIYFLEYNVEKDIVHIQNTKILVNEQEETLGCSLCDHQVSEQRKPGYYKFVEQQIFDHIFETHLGALQCNLCLKTLPSRAKYQQHVLNHNKYKALRRKKRKQNPEKPDTPTYHCDICGKPVKGKWSLRIHKFSHKNKHEKAAADVGGQDSSNSFTCTVCGKGFVSKCYLTLHEASHDPEKRKQKRELCSNCGKCMSSQSFKAHQQSCMALPAVSTEDKLEISSGKIVKETIQQKYNHECHLCSKSFANPHSLRKHLKFAHYSDLRKTYQCEMCSKVLKSKRSLAEHQMTHANDRPLLFCAKNCGKSFKSRHGRKVHQRQCQGSEKRTADLTCPVCSKVCKREGAFALHVAAHGKPQSWLCDHCPKVFTTVQGLRAHMRLVSGVRPHLCRKGCGAGFKTTNCRNRHEKACNGSGTAHGKRPTYVAPRTSTLHNDQ